MKLVGLTGGIASGKSTVGKLFEKLGAPVIDADQVSRDVCMPGQPAIEDIRKTFGDKVIDEKGALDRLAIRNVVFDDKEKLKKLESIVHPRIYEAIAMWLQRCMEQGHQAAIMEATLIIESPPPTPLDALIVVVCDQDVRISRAMARDGFEKAHIRQVMANQLTDNERLAHADFVIKNDGTLEQTKQQVGQVWLALNQGEN